MILKNTIQAPQRRLLTDFKAGHIPALIALVNE